MVESLRKSGYEEVSFGEKADLYVVNTCTVTSKASYQSRQLLRRAHRINPEATIVAAGCYCEIEAQKIASLGIATHILGNVEKLHLTDYIGKSASLTKPLIVVSGIKNSRHSELIELDNFPGRTRAFLKIQDGCNTFCTYCIVPYTRGRCRSVPEDKILKQIERFVSHGFKEVVLTGIHLGKWGADLKPRHSLASLLKTILSTFSGCRFRISSIEPPELNEDIITLMVEYSNFCKHLHVPLQSGCDQILKKMHRPYSSRYYFDLFWKAHKLVPGLAWGLDVIVGFPGETEEFFSETYKFIKELPVAYMHVFPFSPRSGTPASRLPEQVPGQIKKRRAALLRELSNLKRKEFLSTFRGNTLDVLVEGMSKKNGNYSYGLSSNYIRVYFNDTTLLPNTLVNARIVDLFENGLLGI